MYLTFKSEALTHITQNTHIIISLEFVGCEKIAGRHLQVQTMVEIIEKNMSVAHKCIQRRRLKNCSQIVSHKSTQSQFIIEEDVAKRHSENPS